MTLIKHPLLCALLARKMRPVVLDVAADGLVRRAEGEPWFVTEPGPVVGRPLAELCPVFCGLDLTAPMTLPIVELPGGVAIELVVEPEADGASVIVLDASVMLQAVRAQQQLANELHLSHARLETLSRTDALTGLFNRGYWQSQLQVEFKRCQRSGKPACLIMLDIDFFKAINDRYGHPAGDAVIQRLAAALRAPLRATDVVGRYGGEEFGVLLPGTDSGAAHAFAERLRRACADEVVTRDSDEIRFTISLGIAEAGAATPSWDAWLQQADSALYASKHGGRNRVSIAGDGDGAGLPVAAASNSVPARRPAIKPDVFSGTGAKAKGESQPLPRVCAPVTGHGRG